MCTCVHVCVCVLMCVCRPKEDVRCPTIPLPYYLRQDLSVNLELANSRYPSVSALESAVLTGIYVTTLGFCVGGGIPTWLLTLSQQVLQTNTSLQSLNFL